MFVRQLVALRRVAVTKHAKRCGVGKLADAREGWFLPDNEDVSPNEVNSIRPRYTKTPVVNLPTMAKPVTGAEVTNTCRHRVGPG